MIGALIGAAVVLLVQLILFAFWMGRLDKEVTKAKLDVNRIGDNGRQTELKLFYVAMMLTPDEKRQEILNALVRRLT